jgi:predicted tellurium resistance membrane protein TerC
MHAMGFMHLVFGAFLIYTGIQTVLSDDEEEDPSQQPMVLWLQNHMKLVNVYDSRGAFFVKCPIDENGEPKIPADAIVKADEDQTEASPLMESGESERKIDVVDFSRLKGTEQRTETRATMLFLVCVCLNLCDLLFAVDSVSAIVAAVNDLFLAYTSAVFAMLGMRAVFFLIVIMEQLFSLLKYGVSFILVFIGIKLIVGKFYHIPSSIVCSVLVLALGSSMLASVIQGKMAESHDEHKMSPKLSPKLSSQIKARFANLPSPCASPMPEKKKCAM